MNVYNLLEPYKNKICVLKVVNEQFPVWKRYRENFLYQGTLSGENMRERFPGEIVFEFDKLPNRHLKKCREESLYWINTLKDLFNTFKVKFHITDHNGVSPHIRLTIPELGLYLPRIQSSYKKLLIKDILKEINFKSDNVILDTSMGWSTGGVIPLEDQPHWKNKYDTTEQIIYTNSHSYMRLRKDKIRLIRSSFCTSFKDFSVSLSCPTGFNKPKFDSLFKEYYTEGRRHYLVVGVSTILKKNGFPFETTKKLILPLCSTDNTQAYIDIKNKYFEDYPIEKMSPVPMFRLAMGSDDMGLFVCRQFEDCLVMSGDDL